MNNMSDRAFGLVVLLGSVALLWGATHIEASFLSDPVGPKTFPMLIAGVAGLSGLAMMVRPDPEPQWPGAVTWVRVAVAVAVLVAYALALKPMGFLLPTALAAGILSYQISPRPVPAILSGLGLSIGLFLLFRFALQLGLQPWPKGFFG